MCGLTHVAQRHRGRRHPRRVRLATIIQTRGGKPREQTRETFVQEGGDDTESRVCEKICVCVCCIQHKKQAYLFNNPVGGGHEGDAETAGEEGYHRRQEFRMLSYKGIDIGIFFFSFLKSQQETYVASRRIGLSTSTLWPGDVRRFSRNCKITSTSESKERYLNHGVRRERWKEVEDLR